MFISACPNKLWAEDMSRDKEMTHVFFTYLLIFKYSDHP